jgi:D-alanyl-D-alanine carboxypeptidase
MTETSTAPITLTAIAGVLLDCKGQPLFVRHPDRSHPPASLAKLMTLYLAFEAIAAGEVELRDRVRPSLYALLTPHGKLRPGHDKTHSLLSLLKAAMAISDNSSATAIAEHVAANETSFVKRMNQKCRELGLHSTLFATPHGLPHRNQWSSGRDLARLTMRLFHDYPAAGRLLVSLPRKGAMRGFAGSSHLFKNAGGILGFKTGYTAESGYNLAIAARRRGRTLFAVTLGSTSRASSFTDAARLLRYGFSIN